MGGMHPLEGGPVAVGWEVAEDERFTRIVARGQALARPEVKAFVTDYVDNATQLATDAKFVPAPQAALDESKQAIGAS